MNTSETRYLGGLRTESKHLRSGDTIVTDAPPDNNGRGEAFSPTDLTATSLVTCMITVMQIAAEKNGLHTGNVSGNVLKIMAESPRRISELKVEIHFEGNMLDPEKRQYLENVARNCPVAKSLHPDIRQELSFHYHNA